MGRKFYEADVPAIRKSLEKIAKELERQNELKERELKLKEPSSNEIDRLIKVLDENEYEYSVNKRRTKLIFPLSNTEVSVSSLEENLKERVDELIGEIENR